MAERKFITGKYEEYYNSLRGDGAQTKAANFVTEVNSIVSEYVNITQIMNYWSGEAKDAMTNNGLSTILEEFKTTQENIQGTLAPCCVAIDKLSQLLEEMKGKEDLMLQCQNELDALNNNKPSDTIPCQHTKYTDGKPDGKQHASDPNPELEPWKEKVTAKEKEIAEYENALNELKESIDENIKVIEELEAQLKDFTNYMNLTGTVLGIGDSSEFSKYTLEERVQFLQGIIDNYQKIYDSLDAVLKEKFGKGLTFSEEDFKNIDIIFDVFDVYWMAGVNQKDMIKSKEGNTLFLDLEKLTKVIGFCSETNTFGCIKNYIEGQSWNDSGLEDLMHKYSRNVMKINVYDENQFKQRLKEKYNVDEKDIRSFLKNAYKSFDKDGSFDKLRSAYSEYQQLSSTMSVINEKIKDLKNAQKLLPFEMEMDNPDFAEYMKKDYSDYVGLDKEKLSIMSQQEIALYDYLLHNKSKSDADAYLNALNRAFNQRIGAKRAYDYIEYIRAEGFDVGDLVTTGLTGFWDGVRGFGQGIERLFTGWSLEEGDKSILDYEQMYKSIYMQNIMNDPSFLDIKDNEKWQGWNDLGAWYNTASSIGNMAIPSIIGMIPGGQPLSSVLFGLSAAGNSFGEAKIEGKTTAQAFAYGIFNGTTEALTEYMFGYIPGLSAESKGFLGNLLSEGFEEFVQDYMDVGARAVLLGDEEAGAAIKNLGGIFTGDFDTVGAVDRLNNSIESFKYGMLTTGIMQPGSAALNYAASGAVALAGPNKFNANINVDGKTTTIDLNNENLTTYVDPNTGKTSLAYVDPATGQAVINPKTGEVEVAKYRSYGEYKNALEARKDITNANKVINETLEKVNNGDKLSLKDKVKLNNAVGSLSVEELNKVKNAYSETDQKIIKQATDGIPKISKQTREKFELAETFEQVNNSTDSLSGVEFSKDNLGEQVTRDGRTLGEYIADTKSNAIDNATRTNIEIVSRKEMKNIDNRVEENAKRAEKQAQKLEKKMEKEARKALTSTETKVRESSTTTDRMDSRVSEDRRINTQTQTSEQSSVVEQVRQNTDTIVRESNQEIEQVIDQSPAVEQVNEKIDKIVRSSNQEIEQVIDQSPVVEQVSERTDTTTRLTNQETAQVSQGNQEVYQAAPVMQQVMGQSVLQQMVENETSLEEENTSQEVNTASAASLAVTATMGLTGAFDSKTDVSVETRDSSIDVTPRSSTTTQTNSRVAIEETNNNKQTTTFQEESPVLDSWDFDDDFDDNFFATDLNTKNKQVQESEIFSNYTRDSFIEYVKNDNDGKIVELFNNDKIFNQIKKYNINKINLINDIIYNSKYVNELIQNDRFVSLFIDTASNYNFNLYILNNATCNTLFEKIVNKNVEPRTIARVLNMFDQNYILDSLDNWNYSKDILYELINYAQPSVINKIINNFDIDLSHEGINIALLFENVKQSYLSNQVLNEDARTENIINIPAKMITPELANKIWNENKIETIRTIISNASYFTDSSLLNEIIKSKELAFIKETQNTIELCKKLYSLDKKSKDYYDLYKKISSILDNSKNSNYTYYLDDGRIVTRLENEISDNIIDYCFEDTSNNVIPDINELVNFVKNGHMEMSPKSLSIYEKVINIYNLSVDEKINLLNDIKNVNIQEQLYDDIKKAKNIMNTDIKEKSLSKESIQEFKNEELSEKYGVPVFTPKDSQYFAIVKQDTGYFNDDKVPTGHSFSLISDKNTTTFGNVKDGTTFIYDSSTLNPDQIVHTFPGDSYTMFRPSYYSENSTDRINKLMTVQELIDNTRGYNEILILEQGKKQTDIDTKAQALNKMALYCVDEITEHDVEVAKKAGLGIILVQSSMKTNNSFDELNNNYDSNTVNRITQELKIANSNTEAKQQERDMVTYTLNGKTETVSKSQVIAELEEYVKSTDIKEVLEAFSSIKGEEYSVYKQMYLESIIDSNSDIRLEVISGFIQSAIKNGDISLINRFRTELSIEDINSIKSMLSPNMSILFDNYGINGFDVNTIEEIIKSKTVDSLSQEIITNSTNPTLYEHYKNQAILLCESDSKEKVKAIASIASTLVQKGDIKLLEELKNTIKQTNELIEIRTQLEVIDSDSARVFANINIEKDFDNLLFNAGLSASVGSTSIKYENGVYTSNAYGQTIDITKAVNMHIENIRNMDIETTNRYMQMIVENRSLLFGQYSENGKTSTITYNINVPVETLINNIDLSFFNDPNYDILHNEIGITYKTKDGSYILIKDYNRKITVPINTIEKHMEALSRFEGDIKEKYNSIFDKLITDRALFEGNVLLSDVLDTHIVNSLKLEGKHLDTYLDFISEKLNVDELMRIDDLAYIIRSIDVSFFEDNNYETLRNTFAVDYKTVNGTYVLNDMISISTSVLDKHAEIYNSLDSSSQSQYVAAYSNIYGEDFKKMTGDYEWVLYVSKDSKSGMSLINSYLNSTRQQPVFTISDDGVEYSSETVNFTDPYFASILNGMQEKINTFDFSDNRIQTILDSVKDLSLQTETKKAITKFLGYKIEELNQKLIDDAINLAQSVVQSNSLEMHQFTNSILIEAFKVENPYEAIAKIKNIFEKNNLPVVGKVYRCFEVLHPNFAGFDFSSNTISPVLENSGNLRRKVTVFTDLIKSTFGSNNRSVNNYLNNIEFGQKIFEQIKDGTFNQDSLSIEEQNELLTFRNHLATMYENTLAGKYEDTSFVRSNNISDDILNLAQKLSPDKTLDFNLGDRLVDMFCGFADIKTVDQAKEYIKTKIETAEKRNIEASKSTLTLEEGDLVKGIGSIKYLGDILQNGSVSKEYLGASADSDSTPLDTDLSRIIKKDGTVNDMISSTAASSYGPIFFVLKNDSRFDITRTKDGVVSIPNNSTKLELFYTGVLGDGHYGIRTGFASSEINYIVSENYDPRIGLEIAKNGFYIPVSDMDGNIVFTYDDYISLRNKMSGLSYYGDGVFNISENLTSERTIDTQTRVVESLGHTNENVTSISSKIKEVLLSSGIDSVFDGYNSDLTSNGAEVYSTGSTSRGTCVPGDSDFDYLVKVDREVYFNKEKLAELKNKFMDQMGLKEGPGGKVVGEIVNETGDVLDVEISFCPRTDKVEFSTDMALSEKINAIKEQNPAHYEEVLANIVTAKEVLKEAHAYKSQKSGTNEGGLGGIGIENWILQNGGSFHDAAVSFLEVADKCESFDEFKEKYHVFDLGENHYSDKVGSYPHEDFVYETDSYGAPLKMTSDGYARMKQALRTYLENEKLVTSTSVETK